MAINKVKYGNETLIDITDTTATANTVLQNNIFYAANGIRSVGTLGDMTGATANADGATGLVPAPEAGDQGKALFASGTWETVPILIESPLTNVSNVSGAYTHTTADSRITADMKCVLLELDNPSAFKAKVIITPGNGEVTLSCADVEGESTVVASFMKVDVRNFTVTFGKEEEDGGDILETKTLPFRSIPEYTGETPTTTRFSDDYYMFDGWNPAIAPVSGDNVYKAKFFNLLVARYLGSGLTTYESDTDTAIGSGAFYGMTGLTSVKSTATTVGANAFGGCTSLTTIDLTSPTGAVSLDATGIPESVTSIFIRSNTVGTLTGTLPTQFTEGSGIIYVHDDLLSDYETAWSTYASHIYPINAYPVRNMADTIKDGDTTFFRKLGDGTGATEYNIGDTKTLDLGSEGNVQFIIAAKNADELADGSGNAGLTLMCNTALKTKRRMNPKRNGTTEGTGAIGGWAKSEIRTYLNESILLLMPEALRNNIKAVKKYSRTRNNSNQIVNNEMTEDMLWIPNGKEVGSSAFETLGPTYDILFPQGSQRIKKDESGAVVNWLLRTVSSNGPDYFNYVYTSGSIQDGGWAQIANSVIFGFCV